MRYLNECILFDCNDVVATNKEHFKRLFPDFHLEDSENDKMVFKNSNNDTLRITVKDTALESVGNSSGAEHNYIIRKVSAAYIPNKPCELNDFSIRLDFLPQKKELWKEARESFHWIPNIKSESHHVAGQHAFRAPVAIVTARDYGAALIPELFEIDRNSSYQRYLDLRFNNEESIPGDSTGVPPYMEYGIKSIVPCGHVYYKTDGRCFTIKKEGISFSFYLVIFKDCTNVDILKTVTGLHWRLFASIYEKEILPQTIPFARYAEYGNGMALQYLWRKGPDPHAGGITLTTFRRNDGVFSGREYHDDIWFHAWFNNMRTAMELAEFGEKSGCSGWMDKAKEIANCLISAPQKDGIFPTIFAPFDGGWISSSAQGGGRELYSLPDCSWSSIWLRKFNQRYCYSEEVSHFLKGYRDFLCKNQDISGGFPCWIFVETGEYDSRLNNSASGALSVWFLGEELISGCVPDEERDRVLDTVKRGADFLVEKVISSQKFDDFELYYSCSAKPLDFYDPITCMYGQNTLAIQWCAECFRVAYILTKDVKYLESGLFCMYLLSLYQQVWNPPFLNFYAFGGFGVMNTDGEWNDARQAQFAETFSNYYDMTGDFEFLRRAVAATRASFALLSIYENSKVCPDNYEGTPFQFEIHGASAENYGHCGRDERSHQSGFHWGTGSALVTAGIMKMKYADLFIDMECEQAIGIDGISAIKANFDGNVVDVEIKTLVGVDMFVIKTKGIHPAESLKRIEIKMNGFDVYPDEAYGMYVAKRIVK